MDKNQLFEIINNGENSKVEFKDERSHNDSIAKEVVALSNFKGGIIIFGIDDNKNIIGIREKKFEERIMNIFAEKVFPRIIPEYEEMIIDDRKIAIVNMDMTADKPYYTIVNNKKVYYIRFGSTSREAAREELLRLFQSSGRVHYELTPVYQAGIRNLNFYKLHHYLTHIRNIDIEFSQINESISLLRNLEILSDDNEDVSPTLCGLLLFGIDVKKFLYQSGITAVKFKGNNKDYTANRAEFTGSLIPLFDETSKIIEPGIIEKSMDFIKANIEYESHIENVVRVDTYSYSLEAIREVLVNAVCHRDYSITGSDILVSIFKNRIEVTSPGSLPNSININKIKHGCRYYRNQNIVNFMKDYNYIEKNGLGIPNKIIKLSREKSGKEPEFNEEGEYFKVTLFAAE